MAGELNVFGLCQYIVLSMEVAGVGFTLTRSHNVVFFEYPWSSEVLKQCIDRCHRIGQTVPVNVWYLFGIDTIDSTSIHRISISTLPAKLLMMVTIVHKTYYKY